MTSVEEPLVVEFAVQAPIEAAFDSWTHRAGIWWPKSDGSEHTWGEIFEWDPPRLIRFHWHLFFDRSQATQVALVFTSTDAGTAIRLEQTGFASLGPEGVARRERTVAGWASVTSSYVNSAESKGN